MIGKATRTGVAALSFVVSAVNLASAEVQHQRHHARYVHAYRIYAHHIDARHDYGLSKASSNAMMSEPAHPYQAYAIYDGLGYGGVPENPLFPMRAPTPPPLYRAGLPCYSLDDCDRKDYDESGTIGRLGLGASPYHPEGPGNPR